MDYCQERCYGRSWHGYLLAHTQSFLFPSSSSFLSFSIAQIRGQSPVSSRSSVPYHRDRDKILKLPTPHGLGGLGLEKATQYLEIQVKLWPKGTFKLSQVKLRSRQVKSSLRPHQPSRSSQVKSSRVYDHNNLQLKFS